MIAFGIMAVGTALFMFTPETFMKMFTTQPSTITAGASALRLFPAVLSFLPYLLYQVELWRDLVKEMNLLPFPYFAIS